MAMFYLKFPKMILSFKVHEGLPIKMASEKFQRKRYFFVEIEVVVSALELSAKCFSHWTRNKKYGLKTTLGSTKTTHLLF